MDPALIQQITKKLTDLSSEYAQNLSRSQYDDASDVISSTDVRRLKTQALAAIERATGRSSVYFEQAQSVVNEKSHDYHHLASLIGIVDSVAIDLQAGYLQSLEQLIHGEVFSDFLEMASHLVGSGYKDAAAVVAGSTLEAHIKNLSTKFGVPLDNNGKPKKADTLNSELVKSNAYSKLDQKNITAWLGLRNSAAHGNYNDYDKQQVTLLISSVRDFLTRNPA
jgi:hypothetical protein